MVFQISRLEGYPNSNPSYLDSGFQLLDSAHEELSSGFLKKKKTEQNKTTTIRTTAIFFNSGTNTFCAKSVMLPPTYTTNLYLKPPVTNPARSEVENLNVGLPGKW